MKNIPTIYKGYLDLIEYPEEKFLGGVYPLYRLKGYNTVQNTGRTQPTTATTIRELRVQESTQLKVRDTKEGTVIGTHALAAVMWIPSRAAFPVKLIPRVPNQYSALKTDDITQLKTILKRFSQNKYTASDVNYAYQNLYTYEQYYGVKEESRAVKTRRKQNDKNRIIGTIQQGCARF